MGSMTNILVHRTMIDDAVERSEWLDWAVEAEGDGRIERHPVPFGVIQQADLGEDWLYDELIIVDDDVTAVMMKLSFPDSLFNVEMDASVAVWLQWIRTPSRAYAHAA